MVTILKKDDYTFFSFDTTYLMVRCTFVRTDLRVVEAKAQTDRQMEYRLSERNSQTVEDNIL